MRGCSAPLGVDTQVENITLDLEPDLEQAPRGDVESVIHEEVCYTTK